ncbi:MAG: shikimate kinase [Thermoanaerobaculaceae bacterium]|nr:shikimate kinase [Thermoanaerobaculaceae bacterium]
MRIFLVGFMGAGKSSTGQALARRLEVPFVDLDACIEERLGASVAEIFATRGEGVFRAEERRQLALCGRYPAVVVATGGGTFAQEANRQLITSLGISVFLDVPWGEILRRLPGKRSERPLFAVPEQAHTLYQQRLPHYRLADMRVQVDPREDAEAVSGRIVLLLEAMR